MSNITTKGILNSIETYLYDSEIDDMEIIDHLFKIIALYMHDNSITGMEAIYNRGRDFFTYEDKND